jgi:hypothetical protein
MKIFRWISTVSLMLSVGVGAWRLYRVWQDSHDSESPGLAS